MFPFYQQYDQMDCGPACLRMIAKFYGRNYSLETLRRKSDIGKIGASLLGISQAAESIGFRTIGVKITWNQLSHQAPLPCIVHWDQNHFIIVYKIQRNRVYIVDPAKGRMIYRKEEFLRHWSNYAPKDASDTPKGIALLLSATPRFFERDNEESLTKLSFSILFKYLLPHKKLILQLALGLLTGSILQLIFPFLTQAVVDIGINSRDIDFIHLILWAQLMLFFGRTSVEFIRSWILLHISTRINISILSDFLIKLMKLPMRFFDTKLTGDIMQRMGDHERIQNFLTGQTLNTLFSLVNLLVFSAVLAYYNLLIFSVFIVSSTLYVIWVILFLDKRRQLDYKRFDISSQNQSTVIQLIQGMQEIKLNNCEREKRWNWEHLQARLFRYHIKNLALEQYQQGGAFFINEGKNILITFLSAVAVINGQLTLGSMLAIQYIIGQLNGPIQQFIGLTHSIQDTKISLERLNEIHTQKDEEPDGKMVIQRLPEKRDIRLKNIQFTYPGAGNQPVFSGIDLEIPAGKVTAVVGMSGSGKTTLLKLLLKFYEFDKGEMRLGDTNMWNLSYRLWRESCGAVMQDGYIFSDSIARNIAVGEDYLDMDKLLHAVKIANILEFIESLPLGFNTKIGIEGLGISQGQRQRILIARAVYKDPEFLFFDEATNSLDANNERVIIENLQELFKGRTVVIVAHRLSTVKGADNIIVLNKGALIEQGTHETLTAKKGVYYQLVKNQLELGT